ncbi:killer cell lectin-like receptor subfamily F member 1 isoform X2 [Rhineura floridana]|uniref:killer cell lectin-like receptor subfamily F member 1 isoform X2 n=1 Tax=Rhineura floridana TaxID=261503 RepID=UPI002AC81EA0|nr:killer cell lectin-like receptor subfamily F member 1 isoform X2 [Rhineura floridana]
MEDEEGYMAIDPATRASNPTIPPKETKDPSSNLLWWKIGLGISLAGVAVLTLVLILLTFRVFQGSAETILQHPVLFPADLCDSQNRSVLEYLSKLPRHNTCKTPSASCLLMNKNLQYPEKEAEAAKLSPNAYQHSPAGVEGSKMLEDFRSTLKQKLCEASTEGGRCYLCPMTWLLHKNKCYWFSESIQPWGNSKEDCLAKKSQLLVMDDQEEEEFIQKRKPVPVWIGLSFTLPHKKWIWVNGSLLNQTLFPTIQPEEDGCGALSVNKIFPELCTTDLNWICQKESVLI